MARQGPVPIDFGTITSVLRKAAVDPAVAGVLIRVKNLQCGFGKLDELHKLFEEFKKPENHPQYSVRKPVIAHLDDFACDKDIALASVADRVYMGPATFSLLTGPGGSHHYLKDLFASIGLSFQVIRRREHKNAFEFLDHSEPSEGQRKVINTVLNRFLTSTATKVRNRKISDSKDGLALLESSKIGPQALLDAGIIDGICAYSDLLREIDALNKQSIADPNWEEKLGEKALETHKKVHETELKVKVDEPEDPGFFGRLFGRDGKSRKQKRPKPQIEIATAQSYNYWATPRGLGMIGHPRKVPKIAIVNIEGAITSGTSQRGATKSTGGETVIPFLRSLAMGRVPCDGLLLRVNSPGGQPGPSDSIWIECRNLQARGIPVVASMGDVAASGGYYVSMGAQEIFAQESTVTGSIGVIMVQANAKELAVRSGIKYYPFTTTPGSALWARSAFSGPDPKSDDLLNLLADDSYDRFKTLVSISRGLDMDRVEELAQGKLYSGQQAIELGLVDRIGGQMEALTRLRELIVDRDNRFAKAVEAGDQSFLAVLPPRRGPFNLATEVWGDVNIFSPNHLAWQLTNQPLVLCPENMESVLNV
eukprot:Clim_evm20s199 gene=Clim_evmTU20s199